MNKHHEALNILITVRRRVLDRLAETVAGNKSDLLQAVEGGAGPIAGLLEFHRLTNALWRLDASISALRRLVRKTSGEFSSPQAADGGPDKPERDAHVSKRCPAAKERGADETFARFIELVGEQRLEEAAQELARVLRMSLDRMTTATRFFARASRVNADLVPSLAELPRRLRSASSAQAMSLLVRTFGFQAVETRWAVQALLGASGAQATRNTPHPSQAR